MLLTYITKKLHLHVLSSARELPEPLTYLIIHYNIFILYPTVQIPCISCEVDLHFMFLFKKS